MATSEGLGWSRIAHGSVQLTTETSAFSRYLLACLITQRRYSFCEFERSKQAIVVLAVNDYVIVRGQQLLTYTRRCSFIKLLAPLAQKIELKQVIAKHDKDDLVDHHRKGAGGEIS